MTKINVSLSDLDQPGDEYRYGIFHDFTYVSDGDEGNSALTFFELKNESGNSLNIDFRIWNDDTRRYEWTPAGEFDGIRIAFRGSIERSEFLQMLQLILETEKMVELINP